MAKKTEQLPGVPYIPGSITGGSRLDIRLETQSDSPYADAIRYLARARGLGAAVQLVRQLVLEELTRKGLPFPLPKDITK